MMVTGKKAAMTLLITLLCNCRYLRSTRCPSWPAITLGGIAPNRRGRVSPFASKLSYTWEAWRHREVTAAVHQHDAKICMQILHSGRYDRPSEAATAAACTWFRAGSDLTMPDPRGLCSYAYHPFPVAPSKIKSPISLFTPKALSDKGVEDTIDDYVRSVLRLETGPSRLWLNTCALLSSCPGRSKPKLARHVVLCLL